MTMTFNGEIPASIVIHDAAGQRTEIVFDSPRTNIELSEDLFEFSAPADVDRTNSEESAPSATPSAVVPASLQFSAPLVGGGDIDAATLAGKPTVFWFWAPT